MTTEEIKQSLCIHDKRNPKYRGQLLTTHCYCVNCVKDKHQLANELLRVKDLLTSEI